MRIAIRICSHGKGYARIGINRKSPINQPKIVSFAPIIRCEVEICDFEN